MILSFVHDNLTRFVTELTCPAIYDSEPITDRKSRFIGHLSPIVHPDQVEFAYCFSNRVITVTTIK